MQEAASLSHLDQEHQAAMGEAEPSAAERVPVTMLSGFLGAGTSACAMSICSGSGYVTQICRMLVP